MHARFLLCTPQYSPSIRNLQCALPLLFLLLAQLMMSAAAAAAAAMGSDGRPSRYESQKRRDWNTFLQYLKNHRPPLELARCSGAHVLEFFRHLDQFGKTKVHAAGCPFFGHPAPPAPCPCPLRQAWGSLDALVGRLRAAFEENGGHPEANPFGARAVRLYLRDVRDSQAKARGITYEKKKRKRPPPEQQQQQQQQQQSPHLAAPATPLAATSMRYELNLLDLRNVEGLNYGHYGDMITAPGAQDEDGVVMSAMESHNLGGFLPLPVFN